MIAQDIINELQLPEDITTQINSTEDKMKVIYDLYKKGEIFLTGVELLRLAIIDGNTDIFLTNFDSVGRVNKDSLELYHLCAKYGRVKELQRLLKWTGYNHITLAKEAAYCGHYNIVKALGASCIKDVVISAARGGQEELVDTMMEDEIVSWDVIAYEAALYGRKELLYSINLSTINIKVVIGYAARGGNMDIVEAMIEKIEDKSKNMWNIVAKYAAFGGHKEIVMIMISKGADDLNDIAFYAALGGHKELLENIIRGFKNKDGDLVGANDWVLIADAAVQGGHEEIVKDMIRRGATNINWVKKC